jgi:membrane protein
MPHRLPPQLRRAWEFAGFVYRHFMHDRCRQHAMELTYTTLFAVVPMMTVTFAILSAVPSLQHISAEIQSFIFKHFIPSTGQVVQEHLADFSRQAGHLTLAGSAMLFVTALMMLFTIEKAFNEIWKVREPRRGVVSFLRYWAVLSLGPLLLGLGFALSSYMMSLQLFSSAAHLVNSMLPGMRLLTWGLTSLGFTLMYVAVPNCRVPLRAAFIGGLFAAFLFEAGKTAFAIFISHFSSYTLVYGAFAVFPVFLLWIYLSWSIILLGVQVSRALTLRRGNVERNRHPVLALMDVLHLFWVRQQRGNTVSDIDVMTVLGEQEEDEWFDFARLLEQQRLIRRTDTGTYVLARDLDAVDFIDFYRQLPWPLPTPDDLDTLQAGEKWAEALRPALGDVHTHLTQALRIPLSTIVAGRAPETRDDRD